MNGNDPITEAELDAMPERADAASKPPWQSFIEGRDHFDGDNFIRIGGLDDDEPDTYVSRESVPAHDADLDFIAGARQHIPRLLAEIRRLHADAQGNESGA